MTSWAERYVFDAALRAFVNGCIARACVPLLVLRAQQDQQIIALQQRITILEDQGAKRKRRRIG